MIEKPLVSIITPCYNSEKFIFRLLDSILVQTYQNIEFIIVNDGSTDDTERVILSYKERFEKRGIKFIYVYKENGGVASAINKGLELFSGDYLTWPDSDDWLTPDSIEKKVLALENNPECGLIVGKLDVRLEDNSDKSIGLLQCRNIKKRNVFKDFVSERGVYVAPVGWMARSNMFLSVCQERHIEDKNRMGQNWQMMFPLAYSYDCVFIDDVIGYYLVRSNSLSRSNKTFEEKRNKVASFMELKINAIKSIRAMEEKEREEIIKDIIRHYSHFKLTLSAQMHNKELTESDYNDIKSSGNVTMPDKMWYLRGKNRAFDFVCKLAAFPIRVCRSLIRRIKQR